MVKGSSPYLFIDSIGRETEPNQFHVAGFRDCSTKFIQYVRSVEGLGENDDLFQRNLLVFIKENLADVSLNGNVQRMNHSCSALPETNKNDLCSSAATLPNDVMKVCPPSTQVYATNDNTAQFSFHSAVRQNLVVLHNGITAIYPDKVGVLAKYSLPTSHWPTDLPRYLTIPAASQDHLGLTEQKS